MPYNPCKRLYKQRFAFWVYLYTLANLLRCSPVSVDFRGGLEFIHSLWCKLTPSRSPLRAFLSVFNDTEVVLIRHKPLKALYTC